MDCVIECSENKELIEQFDRLNNTNLAMKGTPIDISIDEATGRQHDDVMKFIDFCWEYIWLRTVMKTCKIISDEQINGTSDIKGEPKGFYNSGP